MDDRRVQIADVTDVEIKLRLDAESVLEPGDDADQLGPVMPSEELDALGAAKPFGFDRAVKRAGADRVAKGVDRTRARDAGNKAVLDVGAIESANRPGFPAPTIPRLVRALAWKLMVCGVQFCWDDGPWPASAEMSLRRRILGSRLPTISEYARVRTVGLGFLQTLTADRLLLCRPGPDTLVKRIGQSRAGHLAIRQSATTDNDDSSHGGGASQTTAEDASIH